MLLFVLDCQAGKAAGPASPPSMQQSQQSTHPLPYPGCSRWGSYTQGHAHGRVHLLRQAAALDPEYLEDGSSCRSAWRCQQGLTPKVSVLQTMNGWIALRESENSSKKNER